MPTIIRRSPAVLASILMVFAVAVWLPAIVAARQATSRPPGFELDPKWRTIPNNWMLGEVSSIAVDSRDLIWVLHRPRSIPADKRANAAPPVLEFDTSG